MMRKISIISMLLLLAFVNFPAVASEPVDCSALAVNRQVDSWYNQFLASRSEVDYQTSMSAAADFTSNVESLLDTCGLVLGEDGEVNSEQTGVGTVDDPFIVRSAATVDFVTIRIISEQRPADELLLDEGIMPANIGDDMEFFITYLEFNCATSAPGGCSMDEDSFRLVGDMGILYQATVAQYSAYLPESRNVIGGGQRIGGIPFMVNKADTNFRLVYYPNGDANTVFTENFAYFHAQGTQDTMEIFSSNPELLVRRGPGSEYIAIGAFRRGQTAVATGRSTDGQWIRLDAPEVSGWVSAAFVTSREDIGNLTVVKID
jgi:hypothetical protein